MKNYKYLIIGGGMAGDAAIKSIREIDSEGSVGLISADSVGPYNRPPLSKSLWKDKNEEKIWRKTEEQNVDMLLNTTAVNLDPSSHVISTNNGEMYKYEKLLIATGGTPMHLNNAEDVIYYRSYNDYKKLSTLSENKKRFLVVGAGFIGSEISAALKMIGKDVTMIFPGKFIAENIFPSDLAEYVTDYYKNKGVKILSGYQVNKIDKADIGFRIHTDPRIELETEVIVAGIGIKPNIQLAESTGLKTDNGIVVNNYLQTSDPDIYAAGDNTNYYSTSLNKRLRFEHEDNAVAMGKHAGRNMAGESKTYNHLSFFYSDLFELGYEAVGELNSGFSVYSDWKEPYKEGVLYYLEDNVIKGILLWNIWDQVDNARKIILERKKVKPDSLKGMLPS